jgi:hypothetical protein
MRSADRGMPIGRPAEAARPLTLPGSCPVGPTRAS